MPLQRIHSQRAHPAPVSHAAGLIFNTPGADLHEKRQSFNELNHAFFSSENVFACRQSTFHTCHTSRSRESTGYRDLVNLWREGQPGMNQVCFRSFRNVARMLAERRVNVKLFHRAGAQDWKARVPVSISSWELSVSKGGGRLVITRARHFCT